MLHRRLQARFFRKRPTAVVTAAAAATTAVAFLFLASCIVLEAIECWVARGLTPSASGYACVRIAELANQQKLNTMHFDRLVERPPSPDPSLA